MSDPDAALRRHRRAELDALDTREAIRQIFIGFKFPIEPAPRPRAWSSSKLGLPA
jgi:hypothetical protein